MGWGWTWEQLIWTHPSSMKTRAPIQGPTSTFSRCLKIASGEGRAASLSVFVGQGCAGIIIVLGPIVLGRGGGVARQ